jgi:hypothetical protein
MATRTRTLLAILLLVSMLLTPALAAAAGTDNAAFDAKFSGVITGVPAAAGDSWQIAGHTVKTDTGTKVMLPEGTDAAAVGMWADVTAKKDTQGALVALKLMVKRAEMRLIGPVQTIAEGDLGTWTVAGVDFTVNDQTRISDRGEPIMVDGWVEVHAAYDGTALIATSIKSAEEQEDVELYGAIEQFADGAGDWTISSVGFTSTADTRVMGKPEAGLLAKASLKLQDDNLLEANNIKVSWDEQGGWRMPVQFTGKIEALPPDGLAGTWTVDGKQVDVSAQTKVMQKKALAEVGATVHVVGWTEDARVKALLITVIAGPTGSMPFMLQGVIESLPEGGLVGDWMVSGNLIKVTEATRIAGAQFVEQGAAVTVVGTQNSDGVKTATLIHAKKGH